MINRRRFMQLMSVAVITLSSLAISCNDVLEKLCATLGDAVAKLAAAIGHEEMADKLRHDTDLIVSAVRAWHPGMNAAHIIHLLNALIHDIQLLEAFDRFRPLVTFALGTAASIIEYLNRHGGSGEVPDTAVRLTSPPQDAGQFRMDWDAIRAGSPNMHAAPVL